MNPTAPHSDDAVIELLRASRLFQAFDAVTRIVSAAVESSRVAAVVRSLGRQWHMAPRLHLRLVGVVLVAAGIVHVVLDAVVSRPPGWYWLAIPSATVLLGVLLLADSLSRDSVETNR